MQSKVTIAILASLGLGFAAPAAAQWHEPVLQGGWNDDFRGDPRSTAGWNGRHQGQWNDNGYCRRSDGSTGTVLGAVVGGVIGNQVARRDERTLPTVAGAVVGGLLGRSIDRGRRVCR